MLDLEKQEIKIGDRIVGKKTGTLTPSTVHGIITCRVYLNTLSEQLRMDLYKSWSKHYPDFEYKNVIISVFDEPTRNLSFEEYLRDEIELLVNSDTYNNGEIDFTFHKTLYKNNKELFNTLVKEQYILRVPKIFIVSYPEDDVEVI